MKLLSIEFRNLTPTQFKASNLSIVREVYDARVTLEDIIMTSIMNSLPREYDNAKIALASKIDDDSKDDKDVYEYIQHTTNIHQSIPNLSGNFLKEQITTALKVTTNEEHTQCRCLQ